MTVQATAKRRRKQLRKSRPPKGNKRVGVGLAQKKGNKK